jgi:hypothetical protein
MANASRTRSSACLTLLMAMYSAPQARANGAWSISCRVHTAVVGTSPANTTSGMSPRAAVASAVITWVKPGPWVTEATPTFPVT